MKILTAEQIAAELRAKPSSQRCIELQQNCEPARQALRARLAEISQNGIHGDPPERARAVLSGVDAVLALDREIERCGAELDQLSRLEALCVSMHEDAKKRELAKEIPAAVKRVLKGGVDHIRECLSNLEAAIAATQGDLNVIGEFENAGIEYPFNDDQLAELLELRNRVWQVRHLNPPHNIPAIAREATTVPSLPPIKVPGDDILERYPKSWRLLYSRRRGERDSAVISLRRPPVEAQAPDSASDDGSGQRFWPRLG